MMNRSLKPLLQLTIANNYLNVHFEHSLRRAEYHMTSAVKRIKISSKRIPSGKVDLEESYFDQFNLVPVGIL
eukprot:UN12619